MFTRGRDGREGDGLRVLELSGGSAAALAEVVLGVSQNDSRGGLIAEPNRECLTGA